MPPQPAPIRDILDRALAGARLSEADAIALIECPDGDLDALLCAAAELRDQSAISSGIIVHAPGSPGSLRNVQ